MKEARHKRTQPVRFHLCKILESANYYTVRKDQWLSEARGRSDCKGAYRRRTEMFCVLTTVEVRHKHVFVRLYFKRVLFIVYHEFFFFLYIMNYVCSVAQLWPTLWDPMDCSQPGSSICGISQTRTLEWVAISSSRGSSQPRDQTHISYISCICRWISLLLFFLPLSHLRSPYCT